MRLHLSGRANRKSNSQTPKSLGWCALVCALALAAGRAEAVEQYEEFLKALTDQGLYDLALDYIETMRDSPLLGEAQKQQMPFDEGRLLMRAAQAERNAAGKAKLLDRARDRFHDFIKANPSNPLAANAELELGNVLVEHGKSLRDQAGRPTNAAKKDALTAQAREIFQQAKKVFDEADQKLTAKAKSYPAFLDKKKKKEEQQSHEREKAYQDALMAHIYSAGVLAELAKTYPAGSDDYKKLLQQAADKYGGTYEKHRRILAGQFARVSQAQCYQDLGENKKALGMYEDVLSSPGEEEPFRRLKTSALPRAMQCWTSDAEKNYATAADRGEEWLEQANANLERSPEGLAIRYYTALADKLLADTLTSKEDEARKKTALAAARKHAQFVAKQPGDYRDEAKQLSQKLPGGEAAGEQQEPTNFAEARDQAKEALDQSQDKLAAIKMAPTMNDQANVPKYQAEADQLRDKAARLFKRALELRGDETPLDDVNAVRYWLAFLAFHTGRYYEAAVLGEFIARNYSSTPIARQCAQVALAAYQQSYSKPLGEQKEFDKQKMVEMAELITRAWPGQEEADVAWSTLIEVAVKDQQPKLAMEYLAKIPGDSPRRGNAELMLGQSLWGDYLRAARREEAERPPQAELDQMAATARQTLDDGLKRMRAAIEAGSGDVTSTIALATYSLAQIYLESGQAAQALDLLNDPKVGPLTLAAAHHPAVQTQGKFNYAVESYKLALRAYVATEALDKAEQTMDGLEKLVNESGDADAATQLTRIYISLGRELEAQVQRLRQEKKAEELAKVSEGFKLFLQRISQRDKGNNFNSLNWVAATFYSLGTGYDSAAAKEYYEKSLQIDQAILGRLKGEADFAPAGAEPVVRLRMAKTERALRNFKGAIDLLADVLQKRANMVDAQVEAAVTYQEWGAVEPKRYVEAIGGALKHKDKNGREDRLIWGWARIAIRTQPLKDARMQDFFYLARYNLAKCRLEYAKQKSGKEKAAGLQKAETDILFTHQIRPTLGGPEWYKKFEDLLKHLQQLQGKKPTGLPTEVAKPKKTPEAKPVSATKGIGNREQGTGR